MQTVGKTLAEVIKEEGFLLGRQVGAVNAQRETLLRQLRLKFRRVPAAIEAEIYSAKGVKKLGVWLTELVFAKTLSDIHFSARA